ncbi:MAG: hypothetical protein ABR499_04010 [Gemmatimonadaceae bacterium]
MRIAGAVLMLCGAFFLVAVALATFGPDLRAERVAVGAYVTSVPSTLIVGIDTLVAGAYLRRRAKARRTLSEVGRG